MDLIERYVAAVGRNLPDATREDVTAELRDVLLNQVEEREAELGRPLTPGEVEAMLKRFGHPLAVAGRYRGPEHLIGPQIYPFWWASLKATAVTVGAIYLVLAVVKALLADDIRPLTHGLAPSLYGAAVWVFAGVTAAFVLIERYVPMRVLEQWRTRELPPASQAPASRFNAAASLTVSVVFVLWWVGAIRFRSLLPEQAVTMEMAPVWDAWWWPILAWSVLETGMYLMRLIRPYAARLNAGMGLAWSLAGAAICLGAVQADRWVEITGVAGSSYTQAQVQALADRGFRWGLISGIAVFALTGAGYAWRLWGPARLPGRLQSPRGRRLFGG